MYHHGKKPEQTVATTYPIVDNHADIDFYLLNGTIQDKKSNLVNITKNIMMNICTTLLIDA